MTRPARPDPVRPPPRVTGWRRSRASPAPQPHSARPTVAAVFSRRSCAPTCDLEPLLCAQFCFDEPASRPPVPTSTPASRPLQATATLPALRLRPPCLSSPCIGLPRIFTVAGGCEAVNDSTSYVALCEIRGTAGPCDANPDCPADQIENRGCTASNEESGCCFEELAKPCPDCAIIPTRCLSVCDGPVMTAGAQ